MVARWNVENEIRIKRSKVKYQRLKLPLDEIHPAFSHPRPTKRKESRRPEGVNRPPGGTKARCDCATLGAAQRGDGNADVTYQPACPFPRSRPSRRCAPGMAERALGIRLRVYEYRYLCCRCLMPPREEEEARAFAAYRRAEDGPAACTY